MKQILVLFGGCSPEYSVSLASAYGVLTHMDRSLYQPIPVGITQEKAPDAVHQELSSTENH